MYTTEMETYLYSHEVINDVPSLIATGNSWQLKQNKKGSDNLSLPNEAEILEVFNHHIFTSTVGFSLLKRRFSNDALKGFISNYRCFC